MTILVVMMLVVVGITTWLWRLRKTASVAMATAAVIWFGVGCGPIAQWLVGSLRLPESVPPSWQARNVLVLLGAGTTRLPDGMIVPSFYANGRIIKAAELYRRCIASDNGCAIEVSGGDALHTGKSEAEIYAGSLRSLGVPGTAIVMESKSMNTWQNAQFSAPLLKSLRSDAIWLISSSTHLRRATLYFDHAGIATHPAAADYPTASIGWLPQAWNFALADVALHEYVGVWQYEWYEFMGWNAPRAATVFPLSVPDVGDDRKQQ